MYPSWVFEKLRFFTASAGSLRASPKARDAELRGDRRRELVLGVDFGLVLQRRRLLVRALPEDAERLLERGDLRSPLRLPVLGREGRAVAAVGAAGLAGSVELDDALHRCVEQALAVRDLGHPRADVVHRARVLALGRRERLVLGGDP